MDHVNRNHKSSLFADYFGSPQRKENLLSLFNALNKTSYTDVNALEITTIENVIYMGIKNDISCIIDSKMSLLEHQSTFNPNMPLRGLMYFGKLYNKYLAGQNEIIYRSSLVQIPTPQYFVFYNGSSKQPESLELRLSDAFLQPDPTKRYEWTAIMLNINPGYNKDLINNCQALREYSIFVSKVRSYTDQGFTIDEAVTNAVNECIAENIMKDYLIQDKAGVIEMCLTEYDAERHMQLVAEEIAEQQAIIDKQKEENAKLASQNTELASQVTELASQNTELASQNAALLEEIKRLKSINSK